ncbi:MAG: hypothetical protein HY262_11285 [Chloroflexi bacterium]|nr:hypothetical protein [Chloroflexota bacterium]
MASFLPIIVVGPISDLIGTTWVIVVVAVSVLLAGLASVAKRGPLLATDTHPAADPHAIDPIAAALGADRASWDEPIGSAAGVVAAPHPSPAAPAPSPVEPGALDRSGPSDPTDRA